MKKQKRKEGGLYIVLIIIGVSLIFYSAYWLMNNQYHVDSIRNSVSDGSILETFQLYTSPNPTIDDRFFLGKKSAPITMLVYSDLHSDSLKYFIETIFPIIEENYINKGKVKYYHKNYITKEDIESENTNYYYIKSLMCIANVKAEAYYLSYFEIIKTEKKEEIKKIIKKFNISLDEWESCMEKKEFDQIREDMVEIHKYNFEGIQPIISIGLLGRDNRIFWGIPRYETIRRTILDYQTAVGD
jgi:hypothetical protein